MYRCSDWELTSQAKSANLHLKLLAWQALVGKYQMSLSDSTSLKGNNPELLLLPPAAAAMTGNMDTAGIEVQEAQKRRLDNQIGSWLDHLMEPYLLFQLL